MRNKINVILSILAKNGFDLSTEKHEFINGFSFPSDEFVEFCGMKFATCVNIEGKEVFCDPKGQILSHKIFGDVTEFFKKDGKIYIVFNESYNELGILEFTEEGEFQGEIIEYEGKKYYYRDKKHHAHGTLMDFGDGLVSMDDGSVFLQVSRDEDGNIIQHDTEIPFEEPESIVFNGKRYFFNFGNILKKRKEGKQNKRTLSSSDGVVSYNDDLKKLLGISEDILEASAKNICNGLVAIRYKTESDSEVKSIFLNNEGNRVKILNSCDAFIGNKKLNDCEILGYDGKVIGTMYLEYDFGGTSNIMMYEGQIVTKVSKDARYGDIFNSIEVINLELLSGDTACVYSDFTPFLIEGKEVFDILKLTSGVVITFYGGEKKFFKGGDELFTPSYKDSQLVTRKVDELV